MAPRDWLAWLLTSRSLDDYSTRRDDVARWWCVIGWNIGHYSLFTRRGRRSHVHVHSTADVNEWMNRRLLDYAEGIEVSRKIAPYWWNMPCFTPSVLRHRTLAETERTVLKWLLLLCTHVRWLIDWVLSKANVNVPRSHQKYGRSYRGRVLRVKWPNQQCQSTEGTVQSGVWLWARAPFIQQNGETFTMYGSFAQSHGFAEPASVFTVCQCHNK